MPNISPVCSSNSRNHSCHEHDDEEATLEGRSVTRPLLFVALSPLPSFPLFSPRCTLRPARALLSLWCTVRAMITAATVIRILRRRLGSLLRLCFRVEHDSALCTRSQPPAPHTSSIELFTVRSDIVVAVSLSYIVSHSFLSLTFPALRARGRHLGLDRELDQARSQARARELGPAGDVCVESAEHFV